MTTSPHSAVPTTLGRPVVADRHASHAQRGAPRGRCRWRTAPGRPTPGRSVRVRIAPPSCRHRGSTCRSRCSTLANFAHERLSFQGCSVSSISAPSIVKLDNQRFTPRRERSSATRRSSRLWWTNTLRGVAQHGVTSRCPVRWVVPRHSGRYRSSPTPLDYVATSEVFG